MLKTVPYDPPELVNKKTGLQLVQYITRCRWCKGRLTGTTFPSQVPLFCCPTHKRRYRTKQRSTIQNTPPGVQRSAYCHRCGSQFWTPSILRSQKTCSVLCLFKSREPERYSKCWRKIPHWSMGAAIRAAWKLAQGTGDHGTQPYHCEYCNHWHIGHKPEEKS